MADVRTSASKPQLRAGATHRAPPRRRRALLAVLGASALLLAACSSATPKAAPHPKSRATTTTAAAASAPLCPLTGAPTPDHGPVPQRPALAIKVDNYPLARPQSGLQQADIVFEEPVEGGITRYVAVYQCQEASLVGPIRSARELDIGILGQLGAPLLVHVGGITPVLNDIDASPLINLDLGDYGQVEVHPAGRDAPYDTYASTASLWGLQSGDTTTPPPLFSYSNAVPSGSPVTSVSIPFSGTSNVVWRYVSKIHAFQRFYGLTPDLSASGGQETAANVVVQFIQTYQGPWAENDEGGYEVEANLYDDASGPAEVFRSGVGITGSWERNGLATPTQFLNSQGQPINLQPGQTWVELVPVGVDVTTTAPAPTPLAPAGSTSAGTAPQG